jgi:hypothetical protein
MNIGPKKNKISDVHERDGETGPNTFRKRVEDTCNYSLCILGHLINSPTPKTMTIILEGHWVKFVLMISYSHESGFIFHVCSFPSTAVNTVGTATFANKAG